MHLSAHGVYWFATVVQRGRAHQSVRQGPRFLLQTQADGRSLRPIFLVKFGTLRIEINVYLLFVNRDYCDGWEAPYLKCNSTLDPPEEARMRI